MSLPPTDRAALDRLSDNIGAGPVQSTPTPKKLIMVAKKFPPDLMGEDLQYTHPERKSVPVSVLSKREHGPRRTRQGHIVAHTLLGDAQDFEAMERELAGYSSGSSSEDDEVLTAPNADMANDATMARGHRASMVQRLAVDESKRKQAEEKRMWLSQLHIFQRYREVREEHALKNWQRHSIQWQRTEALLAKKSQRTSSNLLMARLGEYRERLEAHELVETALRLLDEEHVDFWKMGLRLGSDLLGLTMPFPRGGPRQIERVRTYEGRTRTKSAVGRRQPPNAKADMYGDIISLFDPFYSHGDSGYLALQGHNNVIPPRLYSLASTYVSALDTRTSSAAHFAHEENAEELEDDTDANENAQSDVTGFGSGPQLMLAVNRLAFRVVLDQVDTSVLTVYNRGSTACEFEWVKIQRPNPLGVKAIYDPTQRFFFYHKSGVIQPGSAYDFHIIFKSAAPGIYTEQWELMTTPLLESQPVLTLQGIAVAVDFNAGKRRALEAKLVRAQALTTAEAIIESLLNGIKPRVVSARSLRRLANSRDEQTFVKRNKELGLYYVPKIFARFVALAQEARAAGAGSEGWAWDRSVASLANLIAQIQDADMQSTFLRRLNSLIDAAGMKPTETMESLLRVIAYDSLSTLAEEIADVSDTLRRRFQLPLMRAAARFDHGDASSEDVFDSQAAAPQLPQAQAPVSQPAPLPPAQEPANARKPTPPVGTPGEEKSSKKASGPSAAAGKKGAAAAAPATAPAGGKGKPGTTPAAPAAAAATAAPPAATLPATTKAGKTDAEAEQAPVRAPLVLAKVTAKQKKPDSSRGWNRERKLAEEAYRMAFRTETRKVIGSSFTRMCELFEDAGSAF
ncbi:hypothetical protein HDU89_005414 [Geranomyces variabilis]|nr:hypothetical protein HDU89_005414 [Geranomyces variabilis]